MLTKLYVACETGSFRVYLADNHNAGCVQMHVGCSIMQPPLQSLIFRYEHCI